MALNNEKEEEEADVEEETDEETIEEIHRQIIFLNGEHLQLYFANIQTKTVKFANSWVRLTTKVSLNQTLV
jgi:hypothetical protein